LSPRSLRRPRQESAGSVYSIFQKPNRQKGKDVNTPEFPVTKWISVGDGTRESGDMEDRAARYIRDQNILLVNGDFRGYADTVQYWQDKYRHHLPPDTSGSIVTDVVRNWFEQALVETVLGVSALEHSKEWSSQDIDKALSDETLTAVATQRYHMHTAVARGLGAKIGSLKNFEVAS
jgi:hypothetical protein